MRFEVRPLGLPLNNSRPTDDSMKSEIAPRFGCSARGGKNPCWLQEQNVPVEARIFFSLGDLMESETSRVFLKRRLRSLTDRQLKKVSYHSSNIIFPSFATAPTFLKEIELIC